MKPRLAFTLISIIGVFFLNAQVNTLSVNPGSNGNGTCTACSGTQDGNGTLGLSYQRDTCGLNYVVASLKLEQRDWPFGTLQPVPFVISGIPSNAIIEKAFLWADFSGTGVAVTATITNPANVTQNFPMTVIGSGPDKCWGYQGSYSYRADVTPIVAGNGNYIINGLPTVYNGINNDVDGAVLMVVYRDPAATYQGHLVIHDGAFVKRPGTATYSFPVSPCDTSTMANAFMAIGDLQVNSGNHTYQLNGASITVIPDMWNYIDQPTTQLTPATTSALFEVSASGDCFNFLMCGLYYQTTNCMSCIQPVILSVTSTPTCDSSGTASVTASGGIAPYTYSWSPAGGNAATASNLAAGTYTVTVTDAAGNISTATVVVGAMAGVTASVSSGADVSCFGANDGTATATPSGGTSPYVYSWSPSGGNSATASNLSPGTYSCTITDANGCSSTAAITITEPAQLSTVLTSTDISCNGSNDGSGTATPSGGTPAYSYLWQPTGGTGSTASGLAAGSYTCTITDANGCTATAIVSITEPLALVSTASVTPVLCNGEANGSAAVTASGGTGTLAYSWSPAGGSGANASGLSAGTYTCTITDMNGCTGTEVVTITEPQPVSIALTGDTICPGEQATLAASGSGGVAPYAYLWPDGSSGNSITISPAANTSYSVTVTDANGCSQTAQANVVVNPAPVAAFSINAPNGLFLLNDGTGQLCFTDASTGALSYLWDMNGNGTSVLQNPPCITLTSADTGLFCTSLFVLSAAGCADTSEVCITIGEITILVPNVFTPNGDGTNDVFTLSCTGYVSMNCEIYDRWGVLVYSWDGTSGYWDGNTVNGNRATDGVYYFVAMLTDITGNSVTHKGFVHLLRNSQ